MGYHRSCSLCSLRTCAAFSADSAAAGSELPPAGAVVVFARPQPAKTVEAVMIAASARDAKRFLFILNPPCFPRKYRPLRTEYFPPALY